MDPESKNEQMKEEIVGQLKDVQNEYAQLAELDELEHDYAMRLVDSLRSLQSDIDVALPIDGKVMDAIKPGIEQSYLLTDAVVSMVGKDGVMTSQSLTQFASPDILKVVHSVTPELKKVIEQKKNETSERVDLIERILKEIKKAGTGMRKGRKEAPAEEDLIESSITNG
ncbi:MAG: hypothetical protein JRN29_05250 [Nitrososphaerota archaeon]|nr:hypothetical protein [Nitrososphaerota archaeon]